MNYCTSRELSEKWGISQRRIVCMAAEGRFPGAEKYGKSWIFPEHTQKPADGRTKEAKAEHKDDFFRFPLFLADESSYFPPLISEEALLRKAQLDYYACDYDSSKNALDTLADNTGSIYIRIMSLFYLCSLAVEVYCGKNYAGYFARLRLALAEDFPHKKDMELVIPWLYTITVQFQNVSDNLTVDPLYEYSPAVQPLISYLSFYHLSKVFPSKKVNFKFDVYEILCSQLAKNGFYYEACELHFVLFVAYYISMMEEAMLHHLKKGLDLVNEHRFYIIAASYESYYQSAFNIVLKDYPEDFVNMIRHNSELISESIGRFSLQCGSTDIFSTLSKNDYSYLIYAVQGKTYKQVAHHLNISERTVANRYADIFAKLGIGSKNELMQMMEDASIAITENAYVPKL